MSPLQESAELLAALAPLLEVVEASGFQRAEGQQPTWTRTRSTKESSVEESGVEDGVVAGDVWTEKVVLWRHPRQAHLHGYVATTRADAMVHWRLFDPEWKPARILPGYFEKGWAFDSAAQASAIAEDLARVVWPRALLWFDEPVDPDQLMMAAGRVPSVVRPGPMLEQHRRRAAWLESQGRQREAAFVRGVVGEIEALFAAAGEAEKPKSTA